MRAVVQRVNYSNVTVNEKIVGKIDKGLMILLGVSENDTDKDVDYLVEKIVNLRIFEDGEGKLNLSLLDIGGQMLVVSQFTLYGDCKKGRRPSFTQAAKPDLANKLYNIFVNKVKSKEIYVETGIFQAEMKVLLENDGPVTLLIDSEKKF